MYSKEQQEAINYINGQLLVIACPGAGKTTTMIARIHHMIEEGIDPSSILMMTFSNAAAKEMKEKFRRTFPEDPHCVNFMTIHALCLSVLRDVLGNMLPAVLTTREVYTFFINKLRGKINNKEMTSFIQDLLLDIGNVKNKMIAPEDHRPSCTNDKKLFISLYYAYEEMKKERNKIDFDDMLLMTLDHLLKNESTLKLLKEKYQYIQVDEYQDTNTVQAKIIYLMAGENGNLAIVGDDDQSIYGFRAASPGIMLDFPHVYKNTKIVKMGTNYRSYDEIIQAADCLIKHNKDRFQKNFSGVKGKGGQVIVSGHASKDDELEYIVNAIKRSKDELKDHAILFRTNKQAESIARELSANNIPFYSTEPVKPKYESFIFDDIMSFHDFALNARVSPEWANDLHKLINKPNRFIPKTVTACGPDKNQLLSNANKGNRPQWQKDNMIDGILDFFCGMKKVRLSEPKEALKAIYTTLNYKKYLEDYAEIRDLPATEYTNVFKSFQKDVEENNIKTWEEWMEFIERYCRIFQMNNKKKEENAVVLSTMHKSKGLEWNNVFLIDTTKKMAPFVGRDGLTEESEEEERRLFYVGMTRAKKNLQITYYGEKNGSKYLKEIQPKIEAKQGANGLTARLKNL